MSDAPRTTRRTALLLGLAAAGAAAAGKTLSPAPTSAAAQYKTMFTGAINPATGDPPVFSGTPEDSTTRLRAAVDGDSFVVTSEHPDATDGAAIKATSGVNVGIGLGGRFALLGIHAVDDAGAGVLGFTDSSQVNASGVHGRSNGTATGVLAENQSGNGLALLTYGPTQFQGPAYAMSGLRVGSILPPGGDGVLAADYLQGDGAGITNLSADNLSSGTVPDERLSPSVARTDSPTTSFAGTVAATGFTGSGAALSALNASNLSAGAVPDARLSTNVALKTSPSTNFKGAVSATRFTGPANRLLSLSGAGTGAVPKGKANARVTVRGCKTTSKVLVTLQSDPSGAAVSFVKPRRGSFELKLTAPAKSALRFAYFVIA